MLRKLILFFSLLFFTIIICEEGHAQQRFKAGAILGVNASQILRDDVGGYNRPGMQGGLRAVAILTKKTDLLFEILYSQRGSRGKDGSPKCFQFIPLSIATQYIEVPVMATFKDWLDEEGDFYKIQVSGGFSYGRLLEASAEGSCHDDLTDLFNKNDISFAIGVEYFSNEHLTFGVRWSRSINLLYNRKEGEAINRFENSLRGFFLSFRAGYIF